MALAKWVFAAVLALLATPAFAAEPCKSTVASLESLNGPSLFKGTIDCSKEGQIAEANLLLIIGQLRSTTDLAILKPADGDNAKKAGGLYQQIFYQFGGLGDSEFYRSPKSVEKLVDKVAKAKLEFSSGYDPGWKFEADSKINLYAQYVSMIRDRRIWQMREFALHMQNEEYQKVYQAEQALRKKHGALKVGSPEFNEDMQLLAKMRDAEKSIPQLPPPKDTFPYAQLAEESSSMAKKRIAVGFNAPKEAQTLVLTSEISARASWLKDALSTADLDTAISKVDFSKQAMIAVPVGERQNASGKVYFSALDVVDAGAGTRGYKATTVVGIVPPECKVQTALSSPFVVGVVDAVADAKVISSGTSNFPDNCGNPVKGEPAN